MSTPKVKFGVRMHQGGDLHEIAEDLRIRYEHLLALEETRFDDLPGPTYVVGFLRSYATYLGLDAEQLIQTMPRICHYLRPTPRVRRRHAHRSHQ